MKFEWKSVTHGVFSVTSSGSKTAFGKLPSFRLKLNCSSSWMCFCLNLKALAVSGTPSLPQMQKCPDGILRQMSLTYQAHLSDLQHLWFAHAFQLLRLLRSSTNASLSAWSSWTWLASLSFVYMQTNPEKGVVTPCKRIKRMKDSKGLKKTKDHCWTVLTSEPSLGSPNCCRFSRPSAASASSSDLACHLEDV